MLVFLLLNVIIVGMNLAGGPAWVLVVKQLECAVVAGSDVLFAVLVKEKKKICELFFEKNLEIDLLYRTGTINFFNQK